jgi:hypothetical protein
LASLKLGVRGTIFGPNVEKSICRGTYATTAICSVVPDGSPANSPLHPTQRCDSKTKANISPVNVNRSTENSSQEVVILPLIAVEGEESPISIARVTLRHQK